MCLRFVKTSQSCRDLMWGSPGARKTNICRQKIEMERLYASHEPGNPLRLRCTATGGCCWRQAWIQSWLHIVIGVIYFTSLYFSFSIALFYHLNTFIDTPGRKSVRSCGNPLMPRNLFLAFLFCLDRIGNNRVWNILWDVQFLLTK